MKCRIVFLDASFLAAVVDGAHPHHDLARGCFGQLLEEFEAGTTILRSHSGMVAHVPTGVAHVVEVTALRRWLHREAHRVIERHHQLDLNRAAALVLVHREQIHHVATLESWWRDAGVTVLPTSADPWTSGPAQR